MSLANRILIVRAKIKNGNEPRSMGGLYFYSRSATAEELSTINAETESSSQGESSQDEFVPDLSSTPKPTEGHITLNLPKKDTMRRLAPLAHRLQLSNRQQTAIVAGIVKVGGGNLSDTTLSVTSTHRQRRKAVEEKTKEIRVGFQSRIPPRIILHWDGKVITYQSTRRKDDRLCIVVRYHL